MNECLPVTVDHCDEFQEVYGFTPDHVIMIVYRIFRHRVRYGLKCCAWLNAYLNMKRKELGFVLTIPSRTCCRSCLILCVEECDVLVINVRSVFSYVMRRLHTLWRVPKYDSRLLQNLTHDILFPGLKHVILN